MALRLPALTARCAGCRRTRFGHRPTQQDVLQHESDTARVVAPTRAHPAGWSLCVPAQPCQRSPVRRAGWGRDTESPATLIRPTAAVGLINVNSEDCHVPACQDLVGVRL